eukprot:g772.t1
MLKVPLTPLQKLSRHPEDAGRTVGLCTCTLFALFFLFRSLWWAGLTTVGSYVDVDTAKGNGQVPAYYAYMDMSKYPPRINKILKQIETPLKLRADNALTQTGPSTVFKRVLKLNLRC